MTFFVVYLILGRDGASHQVARFPQGEYLAGADRPADGRGGRVAGGTRLSDAVARPRGVPDVRRAPGAQRVPPAQPADEGDRSRPSPPSRPSCSGGLIGPIVLVAVAVVAAGAGSRRARSAAAPDRCSSPCRSPSPRFLVNVFFFPGGHDGPVPDRPDHRHRRGPRLRARDPGADPGDQRRGHPLLPDDAPGRPRDRPRAARGQPADRRSWRTPRSRRCRRWSIARAQITAAQRARGLDTEGIRLAARPRASCRSWDR